MNYFYITGTSRGIGKALAEEALKDENNHVIGVARHVSIEHKNYTHITCDLSAPENAKDFPFNAHEGAEKIALINNAGTLGELEYTGKLNPEEIIKAYNLNLLTPALLVNRFAGFYGNSKAEKTIVNISTGAATTVYDGMSMYCSTKAGLEMNSRVMAKEQEKRGENKIRVFSIAPGVVETKMQEQIRATDEEHFSRKDKFMSLYKQGQLADTKSTARKIFGIFEKRNSIKKTVISVHDL